MDRRALTRLRIGFILVGGLLLLPLWLLLREAEARFEEQRRLRHEIVAERIFDEMERELTALLQTERARPSGAYDAPRTRVTAWSPFVVGYFTRDPDGVHLPARSQLGPERAGRVRQAVQGVFARKHGPAHIGRGASRAAETRSLISPPATASVRAQEAPAPRLSPAPPPAPKEAERAAPIKPRPRKAARQETVLRQLNRGALKRDALEETRKRSAAERPQRHDDPLQGF